MEGTLSRLGYERARQLLLAAGLAVLLIVALVMYIRRVETVEVIATMLFIPIFIAVVFWDLKGGLIAAALAAIAYIALRYPAIDAVGIGRFSGLILSRTVAYLAFGAIGGTANQVFQASLTKLELYDQIDDATGLFNARFFVEDTDLELSRSDRYQTVFSIAAVRFPAMAVEHLGRRQKTAIIKDLGRVLGDSVRNVDRAVHGTNGRTHELAVVLPETGPEGARVFTERLREKIFDYLYGKGARIDRVDVEAEALTFPNDGAETVHALRDRFKEIDQHEHGSTGHPAPGQGQS